MATASSEQTSAEKLQSLASELRSWLNSHGISTPFSLELRSSNSDLPAQVEIHGQQSEKIRSEIEADPNRISGLTRLLKSVEAVAQSVGRDVVKLTVTDRETHISY